MTDDAEPTGTKRPLDVDDIATAKVPLLDMILDDDAEASRLEAWLAMATTADGRRWVARRLNIVKRRRDTLELVLNYQKQFVAVVRGEREAAARRLRTEAPAPKKAEA